MLTGFEGYRTLTPTSLPSSPKPSIVNYAKGLCHVCRLQKIVGGKCVDIITSINDCAVFPIFGFHSMLVLNILGADAVICTYPQLTFSSKCLIHSRCYCKGQIKEHNIQCIEKYRERGFTLAQTLSMTDPHKCGFAQVCPQTARYINDSHCLSFVFGHGSLPPAVGRHGMLWRLGGPACLASTMSQCSQWRVIEDMNIGCQVE